MAPPTLNVSHHDFAFVRTFLEREQHDEIEVTLAEAFSVVASHQANAGAPPPASPLASTRRQVFAMSPIISKDKVRWTKTEDCTIIILVRRVGEQWSRIASALPGRSAHAVMARYDQLLQSPLTASEEGRAVMDQLLKLTERAAGSVPPTSSPPDEFFSARDSSQREDSSRPDAAELHLLSPGEGTSPSKHMRESLRALAGLDASAGELPLGLDEPGLPFDARAFLQAVATVLQNDEPYTPFEPAATSVEELDMNSTPTEFYVASAVFLSISIYMVVQLVRNSR